jgi:hypothetical protein
MFITAKHHTQMLNNLVTPLLDLKIAAPQLECYASSGARPSLRRSSISTRIGCKSRSRVADSQEHDTAQRHDAAPLGAAGNVASNRRKCNCIRSPALLAASPGRSICSYLRPSPCEDSARLGWPPLQLSRCPNPRVHLHVSARRLASHHRQHVVPLDFRRKRGGPARRHGLPYFLSRLRHCFRHDAGHLFLGLAFAIHWSERGDFRHTRRLHCLLSIFADSQLGSLIHYLVHLADSSVGVHRPVVRRSVLKRGWFVERSTHCEPWRSSVVGAHRRIPHRRAVGPNYQTARPPPGSNSRSPGALKQTKNQISSRGEQPICSTEILSKVSECRRADKRSKMLNSTDQF